MSTYINHEAIARRKARLEKKAKEEAQDESVEQEFKSKFNGANAEDLMRNPDFAKKVFGDIFK